MDNILTLTHATERDIDLLLVEELKCSPDFVRWLANKMASITGKSVSVLSASVIQTEPPIGKLSSFDQRSFDHPPPLENYNPFLNDLAICAHHRDHLTAMQSKKRRDISTAIAPGLHGSNSKTE